MSIYGLLGLLVMLAIFVILSILAGIFSWLDYRKEEVALLNEAVGASFRVQPRIGNFWRWYETYMILFIIVFVVVTYCFVEDQVIPRSKTATDQAKTELAW